MFEKVVFITPEPAGTLSGGQLVVTANSQVASQLGRAFYYIGPGKPPAASGLSIPLNAGLWSRITLAASLRTTPLGLCLPEIEQQLRAIGNGVEGKGRILVWVENTRAGFLGPLIRKTLGSRAVILFSSHNVEIDYMRTNTRNPLRRLATILGERQSHRHGDYVLTLTAEDRDRHLQLYRDKAKVVYVPAALPDEPNRQQRTESRSDVLRCLFVGKLSVPQNERAAQFLLREVVPLIPAELRSRVTITIAGGGASAELGEEAARGSVRLVADPDQAMLEELFAASDLLLAPVAGGSGIKLKVMDAMARGLTVIGSPSALMGYENAERYTVQASIGHEYVSAIVRFAHNPNLVEGFRQAGYQRFLEWHTVGARFDRIAEVLRV